MPIPAAPRPVYKRSNREHLKPVLSPKELAQAVGVSESSVKRWADEGQLEVGRTAGGHRRIALSEAVRFIRARGLPVVRPELLGDPQLDLSAPDDAEERLYLALVAGRADQARGLLLGRFLAGQSVAALADGPIRAALRRIGDLWHARQDGLLIEHRALGICHEALAVLRLTLAPRPDAPVAMGGAAPDDPYLLPSLLAALVLEERGLRAVNLGPGTPLTALRQGVKEAQARLAWVSVSTLVGDPAPLRVEIEALATDLARAGGHLVVGGRALGALGLRPTQGLFWATSLSELAAFVAGLGLVTG
jgi:excisionase family DNA binding protein